MRYLLILTMSFSLAACSSAVSGNGGTEKGANTCDLETKKPCPNGTCIPKEQICKAPSVNTCKTTEKKCDDNSCIAKDKVCPEDKKEECEGATPKECNGSCIKQDEECCNEVTHRECDDGSCIIKADSCPKPEEGGETEGGETEGGETEGGETEGGETEGGETEGGETEGGETEGGETPAACVAPRIKCKTKGGCVVPEMINDGDADCEDGSDENVTIECETDMFAMPRVSSLYPDRCCL